MNPNPFEILHNNFKTIEEQIPDNILTIDRDKLLTELIRTNKHIPKISLLGKSGDGKSTLLNKILEKKNFLDTGTGCAVTSCPSEIQYAEVAKFEIEYEDLDNVSTYELKSHIISCKPKKPKLSEDKLNMTWEKHYELLKQKINEEIANFNITYPSNYIAVKNKKLSKVLKHYKSEIPLAENITFKILPLIKKIKIFLPCEILKKMTLVDLPGLNDSCNYRIERTVSYLENETDFIALVNDCNRITSDTFIDDNINSYMINSIIRNNIKDILIVGTMTDKIRKDIKEKYEDSDEDDDEDDDDDDKGDIKEIINIKFKNRLEEIKNNLEEKITNNKKLSLRGITSNDIHILLTSSTLNSEISGFDNFTNKLNEIIDCRACKIKTELKILIEKIYKEFDDYINRPRHEIDEENKLLIEKEYQELNNKLNLKIITEDMKINTDIFTLSNTKHIKTALESQKKEMVSELHGKTTSAVLQKLQHTSCHGTEYDIKEDIIGEIQFSFLKYIQTNLAMIETEIKKTISYYKDSKFIEKSNLHKTLKKLYNVSYKSEDFVDADISIYELFKSIETDKNSVIKSLYDFIKSESLELISHNVKNLLEEYKERANRFFGVGTADKIRILFIELYTDGINNVCNKLNIILIDNFNKLIIGEQMYYTDNIKSILKLLKQTYIKNNINYSNISEAFEELKTSMNYL